MTGALIAESDIVPNIAKAEPTKTYKTYNYMRDDHTAFDRQYDDYYGDKQVSVYEAEKKVKGIRSEADLAANNIDKEDIYFYNMMYRFTVKGQDIGFKQFMALSDEDKYEVEIIDRTTGEVVDNVA